MFSFSAYTVYFLVVRIETTRKISTLTRNKRKHHGTLSWSTAKSRYLLPSGLAPLKKKQRKTLLTRKTFTSHTLLKQQCQQVLVLNSSWPGLHPTLTRVQHISQIADNHLNIENFQTSKNKQQLSYIKPQAETTFYPVSGCDQVKKDWDVLYIYFTYV